MTNRAARVAVSGRIGRVAAYTSIVQTTLRTTPVGALLTDGRPATVYERIARGGGATNWYYCPDPETLPRIEERLQPGSVVSFYFDDRFARHAWSSNLPTMIMQIVADTGDAIIGTLRADGVTIDAVLILSRSDLDEELAELGPVAELFCGATPSRDNDGTDAVTFQLPDEDGVVRPHPH
jgi:hypothetical protein